MTKMTRSGLELVRAKASPDGAVKYVWRLSDSCLIENVILKHEKMTCACISCQVGCPLDCVFCSTAKLGFTRNLTCEEMIGQVMSLTDELRSKEYDSYFRRILFMGMGEPLLNYEPVVHSMSIINSGQDFNYPQVLIATSGALPDKIREMAHDTPFAKLWISLCATETGIRTRLMPIASHCSITSLLDAGEYYAKTTGFPVRVNYLMIKGVTDSFQSADELVHLLRGRKFQLQLTRLNPTADLDLEGSTMKKLTQFAEYCVSKGVPTSLFESKGISIYAGCGQLAG